MVPISAISYYLLQKVPSRQDSSTFLGQVTLLTENVRFTSVREVIEYSSSTSCGNLGLKVKSELWSVI